MTKAGADRSASGADEVSPAVQSAFERGRDAWPGVRADVTSYAAWVAEAAIDPGDLQARAEELFLAWACARGDAHAHRQFEAKFLAQVGGYVGRFRLAPHLLDELRQRVRLKQLFGARPGIAAYRGRGPLGAWVRATAVRVAFDVAAETGHMVADRDAEVANVWRAFDDGPEAETLKHAYRDRLIGALEQSIQALAARDKTLLRMNVVDGLNIDVIGRIYHVHRATVARWLVAIRRRIFDDLRSRAALDWGASSGDLRSLVRILGDDIHLSARRILGDAGDAPSR